MVTKTFSLAKGHRMRLTKLDACGRVVYGEQSQAVSDGFVSTAMTATTVETEEISVTKASGDLCILQPSETNLTGYAAEIVFCDVDPELFALATNQLPYEDADGNIIGFSINTKRAKANWALELWAGVAGGDGCEDDADVELGYQLIPFLRGGIIGDWTLENGAMNFTITGAQSRDGNRWGVGPYNVMIGGASTGVNEVQTVTITGTPTGGTFRLTLNGEQTGTIAYNATNAVVQTALEALASVNPGDVTVAGGPGPGTPYTVTFTGDLAAEDIALMTATAAFTGGTTPAVTVTTPTPGVSPVPTKLPTALDPNDHWLSILVGLDAPEARPGSRPVLNPANTPLTSIGVVVVASQGTFTTVPVATTPLYIEFGDGDWDYLPTGGGTTHVYDAPGVYTATATTNGQTVSTTVTIV